MKKIGIITFHNAYNCGSMLESYAINTVLKRIDKNCEIIDFSNEGQRETYNVFFKNNSIKNIIKNIILLPVYKKIEKNNKKYEEFKIKNFALSKQKYKSNKELNDLDYSVVVSGSDQVWNVTIADSDEAYFLPWVKNAKKVAYAPSFGAKNISKYATNKEKYKKMIQDFDALSIREKNGKKWIKELTGQDVPVLIDPTLLLESDDYNKICDDSNTPKEEYIFFYCPSFNHNICKLVKKISKKYNLSVIAWSAKSYYVKGIYKYGFELPKCESPAVYLSLIKNAKMVITTSFHGAIFSSIYKKNFYVVKNGGMFGDDDRVMTLLNLVELENRLIPIEYSKKYDYLQEVDYEEYDIKLKQLKKDANEYIEKNIKNLYNIEENNEECK